MAVHLFAGGPLEGRVIDVGDPPPAEYRAADLERAGILLPDGWATPDRPMDSGYTWEHVYSLRELVVGYPTGPVTIRVYLAPPELVAIHSPELHPAVSRHVVALAVAAGILEPLGDAA